MNQEVIEYEKVTKSFIGRDGSVVTALRDIELSVSRGEFVTIVGPSGCGKSTLLNLLAGLETSESGVVRYEGSPVLGVNTELGYMTQGDMLLPWRTVQENIAIPLEIRSVPRPEQRDLVAEYTQLVGLVGFENHYPAQLSGGMRKRVGLARTLIYKPKTLILDEPFGSLDAQLKLIMQDELLRIFDELGTTTVFITHDLMEAVALADRVVVMSRRPGRIRTVRTVGFGRPRDLSAIRFSREFGELHEELWELLKDDALHGEAI